MRPFQSQTFHGSLLTCYRLAMKSCRLLPVEKQELAIEWTLRSHLSGRLQVEAGTFGETGRYAFGSTSFDGLSESLALGAPTPLRKEHREDGSGRESCFDSGLHVA